jgi:predicted transcriptional regulator
MVFGARSAFCIGMTSLAATRTPSSAAFAPEVHPPGGAAIRVAIDFLLDQMVAGIEAHDGDLLGLLVVAALSSGNCAHLPVGQFASLDEAPPDRERRPLTIRQVAHSLGQPYETVRRRFVVLEAAGKIARRGRNGFIVPEATDRSPERVEVARRTHAKIQRMVKTLQTLDRR